MGKHMKVGAPEYSAGSKTNPQRMIHAKMPKPSQDGINLPYANTVGGGRSGRLFKAALAACIFILFTALLIAPRITVTSIMLAFTALILLQAALRIIAIFCSNAKFNIRGSYNCFTRTNPLDWPFYSVLVPLKDEAHMVNGLVETLSKLDYPEERLQIIFITEEDDPSTRAAVTAALKPPFEQVVVTRRGVAGPRTKPNALNIAMAKARGEIVTIYDAEDTPHPQQLKTAVRAFEAHPNWGALQAPLDYFNTDTSWLTAQFGLEYAAQFHVWIPLMVRLGLPFPLGGTSNHIRRTALNDVRHNQMFWDSYNVTEDADLSFRLSAHGWNIGYITPPTREEAVSHLKPWIHQRTRWMKGFMQSWRVHMDRPFAPGGWKGLRRQLTLQLTLGSVLLAGFLHLPVCLGMMIWIGYNLLTQGEVNLPPFVAATLAIGYGSGIAIGGVGAIRAGKAKLLLSLPLMPMYWLCLFVPTYRAAYEYVRRPYYWAKTAHGVTAPVKTEADPKIAEAIIAPEFPSATAARDWPKLGAYRNSVTLPVSIHKPANDVPIKRSNSPKAAE